MGEGLLKGTTILEIAHPLTEYAGLVLAGLGATVFMVEEPDGSPTRRRGPHVESASPDRSSVPFLARNVGKRSVVLDADKPEDRQLLADLAARADAILEPPATPFSDTLAATDTDAARVKITDPDDLGVSSVVGFAASGGLSSSGWPHQPPCNAPGWLALDGTSIYAALMAIVGIRGRANGGPTTFEIRYRDAALAAITPWTRPLHSYGVSVGGQGAVAQRLGAGPHPIFRCKDGFVRVLTATPQQWSAWVELLGNPEELTGSLFEDRRSQSANWDLMVEIAGDLVADRTMADLFLKGQALALTITPVLNTETFMADSHVQSREFFQEVDDPDLGKVQLPRPPFRVGGEPTPALVTAPSLGQHNEEARAFAARDVATRTTPTPALSALPLTGVRVLDCGTGAVVPEAASLMALMGADVIKIESRKSLEFLRLGGLGGPGDFNNASTFNQMNLGVKSFAVDMTTEEGRSVVKSLVAKCDILMENLRGPVMGNWGLDYETVKAIRPDIIYLSSQGLGTGDYDGFRTYGPNLQTFSGVTSLWAHPDDPYPVGTTLNHPDHVAGKQSLVAVLAALERRDRTGEGCFLDCAQFETATYLIADKFLEQQVMPEGPRPMGNRSIDYSPHGCYPTEGEDRWIALAVEDDEQWERFAQLVDEEWTRNPEFGTSGGRLAEADKLDAYVSVWTSKMSPEVLVEELRSAGVPVSVVRTGNDLAADEAAHHDGIFECVPHPTAGPRWHTGLPISTEHGRFATTRAPLLGEHDHYVLSELLGLSPAEVSRLAAQGAVGY